MAAPSQPGIFRGDCSRFGFRFERPAGEEIRRHQTDEFPCLKIRMESPVVVFPLQLCEVENRISFPDAVVDIDPFTDPCPQLLRLILRLRILRKAVKLAAAYEAGVAPAAACGAFSGGNSLQGEHCLIVFERIKEDLTVLPKPYAEYWRLPPCLTSTYSAPAPPAP